MEENLFYIGEAYLNRVKLALIGLDYLDGTKHDQTSELLAIEPFNRPLYELLYAAIVTGVEDYLRSRLKRDVLQSEDSMRRYLKKYNYNFRRKKDKQISFPEDTPLSEEIREQLLDSLDHHVYHRIDMVADYLEAVTSVKLPEDDLWNQMRDIIQIRHVIIHDGGRFPNGERIELTPFHVHQALSISEQFIQQAEILFLQRGNGLLYDVPE